jgi:hypothetical protein
MSGRILLSSLAVSVAAATGAWVSPSVSSSAIVKWPPWISIESPVNPYDPSARGAAMLVRAAFREGVAQLSDLNGSAEGIVAGARKSIPLRFDTTGRPNVFALRKQWPNEGTWLLRIALKSTTAIVTLDHAGNVASVRVPTELTATRDEVPRAVGSKEIDSLLAASVTEAAKR